MTVTGSFPLLQRSFCKIIIIIGVAIVLLLRNEDRLAVLSALKTQWSLVEVL